MTNVTCRKRNDWIRNKTKVRHLRNDVAKLKLEVSGQNYTQKDDRCDKVIIKCPLYNNL